MEKYTITISRIRFVGDGGFVIADGVDIRGTKRVLKGVLHDVVPGSICEIEATTTRDPKWGGQLQVSRCVTAPPTERNGAALYLADCPGIGEVTARRIVEALGDGIWSSIENASPALAAVRGVGEDKATVIQAWYSERKATRESYVQLATWGLKRHQIKAALERYGVEVLEVVRANPWRLAEEVDGVGFATADQLAMALGKPFDCLERARAGVLHVLAEDAQQGHCYAEQRDLILRVSRELPIRRDLAESAVPSLALDGKVVVRDGADGLRCVYRASLFAAERMVAGQVAARARRPARVLPELIGGDVSQVVLSVEQLAAVESCAAASFSVLTGGPGTGKSTVSRAVVDRLAQGGGLVLCMAPTGRAAKRLGECLGRTATTIHRALGYGGQGGGFVHDASNPLRCQAVLVDEASMLDVSLASALLDAIPASAQVVLVGDADQLPSVGPGTVFRDIIASGVVPVARLTRVFRQDPASRIALNCAAVNAGDLPVFAGATDSEFIAAEADSVGAVIEQVLRAEITARGFGPRDVMVLSPQRTGDIGIDAMNLRLQDLLNPDQGQSRWEFPKFVLRLGDRVTQRKNDYKLKDVSGAEVGCFNGEVGYVTEFRGEGSQATMMVDYGDRVMVYKRPDAGQLDLAYASTIHRAQGSETPAAIVVVSSAHSRMLSRQLLYTAMSRPKKYVWCIGDLRGLQRAVDNATPHLRRAKLRERLEATKEMAA